MKNKNKCGPPRRTARRDHVPVEMTVIRHRGNTGIRLRSLRRPHSPAAPAQTVTPFNYRHHVGRRRAL